MSSPNEQLAIVESEPAAHGRMTVIMAVEQLPIAYRMFTRIEVSRGECYRLHLDAVEGFASEVVGAYREQRAGGIMWGLTEAVRDFARNTIAWTVYYRKRLDVHAPLNKRKHELVEQRRAGQAWTAADVEELAAIEKRLAEDDATRPKCVHPNAVRAPDFWPPVVYDHSAPIARFCGEWWYAYGDGRSILRPDALDQPDELERIMDVQAARRVLAMTGGNR